MITIEGFKPYKKQKEILRGILQLPVKYHCVTTGRQVGKSLMLENLVYYWAINNSNVCVGIISPVWSQVYKIFEAIINNLDKTPLIKSKDKSRGIINLTNGSQIKAFSAERADNIRGNTFDYLLLDEFAFMKSDAWNTSIKPTTLVKAKKVCFFSTPTTKDTELYKIYNMGLTDDNYKSYHLSSWDNPYIDPNEFNEYKRSLPENVYKNEIEGIFTEDGSGVFRNIENVCTLYESLTYNDKVYIGIDLGNTKDWTVISIFNAKGNQIYLKRIQENDWNKVVAILKEELKKWKNASIWIESNGVGNPVIDQLKPNFSIKSFFTTNSNKQEAIQALIYKCDENTGFLLNDNILKSEMMTFTYKYNKVNGNIQYGARNGFHDDTIMATAIAYRNWQRSRGGYTIEIL